MNFAVADVDSNAKQSEDKPCLAHRTALLIFGLCPGALAHGAHAGNQRESMMYRYMYI